VFAGVVQHGDLPDWYRAADVTVLPSRSEGVPNVLLESTACGTPFVASDVGGIAEVADPLLDRLVPAEHADALAKAITEVAGVRATTPRRFTPVSWGESAASLEGVFRGVIEERKRPR
jgi:glycosyltransferase involved in cell wall biosynthesis